jgi:hypothetical protein
MQFFGFDPVRMKEVAARIGPTPAEVLVDEPDVDPRKTDHFHVRSGFNKPMEDPLVGWDLEEMLELDLAATANRA